MARLSYTIWALMLNSLEMPIFQTCFADFMADEYGEPLLSSSLITSFLIATSVYVIVVGRTLFPESFRKPKPIFLCLYEVSASMDILDQSFLSFYILMSLPVYFYYSFS